MKRGRSLDRVTQLKVAKSEGVLENERCLCTSRDPEPRYIYNTRTEILEVATTSIAELLMWNFVFCASTSALFTLMVTLSCQKRKLWKVVYDSLQTLVWWVWETMVTSSAKRKSEIMCWVSLVLAPNLRSGCSGARHQFCIVLGYHLLSPYELRLCKHCSGAVKEKGEAVAQKEPTFQSW